MVSLERAVSQENAHNYLQEYSIKLSGGDPNDPASEQRGVLIIKSKSKTKAKQRKGAVANWKVIYSLIFIFVPAPATAAMCIRRFILHPRIKCQNLFIGVFHLVPRVDTTDTSSRIDSRKMRARSSFTTSRSKSRFETVYNYAKYLACRH